jgi:hypothetical protein
MKNINYSFSVEDACKYGINESIILYNIRLTIKTTMLYLIEFFIVFIHKLTPSNRGFDLFNHRGKIRLVDKLI